jgi:hypothetical protein
MNSIRLCSSPTAIKQKANHLMLLCVQWKYAANRICIQINVKKNKILELSERFSVSPVSVLKTAIVLGNLNLNSMV